MHQKLAYFFGGVISATGLIVTLTDPENLENIMTFPKRFKNYFIEDEFKSFDINLMRIIITDKLRKNFDETLEMSDDNKDKLANHFANECLSFVDQQNKLKINFKENFFVNNDYKNNNTGTEFNKIVSNIETSIEEIPGLGESCSYFAGITLGLLGELAINSEVQTRLSEEAIKLSNNGGLFTIPEDIELPH